MAVGAENGLPFLSLAEEYCILDLLMGITVTPFTAQIPLFVNERGAGEMFIIDIGRVAFGTKNRRSVGFVMA